RDILRRETIHLRPTTRHRHTRRHSAVAIPERSGSELTVSAPHPYQKLQPIYLPILDDQPRNPSRRVHQHVNREPILTSHVHTMPISLAPHATCSRRTPGLRPLEGTRPWLSR